MRLHSLRKPSVQARSVIRGTRTGVHPQVSGHGIHPAYASVYEQSRHYPEVLRFHLSVDRLVKMPVSTADAFVNLARYAKESNEIRALIPMLEAITSSDTLHHRVCRTASRSLIALRRKVGKRNQ